MSLCVLLPQKHNDKSWWNMRQFHVLSQIIIVLSCLIIISYITGNQISKNFAMLSLNIRTVASLLNMLLIVLMKAEKTFQTKSSKNASSTEDIESFSKDLSMKTSNISATIKPFTKRCGKKEITISQKYF